MRHPNAVRHRSRSRAIDGGMNVRKNTRRYGAVLGVVIGAVAMSVCRYTGFSDAPSKSTAATATGWLVDQQQGGRRIRSSPSFAGFETSDAILAIAENAQQQVDWNTTQARNAVLARVKNGHTIRCTTSTTSSTGRDSTPVAREGHRVGDPATRMSATAVRPRGDATSRPRRGHREEPRGSPQRRRAAERLVRHVQRNGLRRDREEARQTAACRRTPSRSFARAGSERRAGTSTASRPATKPMSTRRRSRSRRSRRPGSRGRTPICGPGSRILADHQRADGAWESFGTADPNSTSTAIFAITAAGFDPASPCWRNVVGPHAPGSRTHRRWSGCGRSRTRASRRPLMRAGSTARATRSVSARSRRASRSRRSGGAGTR